MSDVLFIKNETDLQYYKSLRPKIKYGRLKFKYICNKCGKEKEKQLQAFKNFPCICSTCSYKETMLKNYGVINNFQRKDVKDKIKQTCLDKYGVEYAAQAEITKNHIKESCLNHYGSTSYLQSNDYKENVIPILKEKYGYENVFQSEEIKNKIKETCKERYGTDYATQSDIVKARIKQACLEKYGVESTNQLDSVKEKKRQTCLALYGKEHYLQTDECKNQIKETCLKKYGVESTNQLDSVKEKKRQTCLEHYGKDSYLKTDECKEHVKQIKLERYGDEYFSGKKLYSYNNLIFHSKPELCFYIYHLDNNIPIEYEPKPYYEYYYENELHYYKPDFLVNNEQLYEIKGDQFFNENKMVCPYDHNYDGLYEAKHQCMIKNNVIILKYKEYMKYVKYINEKYGKNYIKQYKID